MTQIKLSLNAETYSHGLKNLEREPEELITDPQTEHFIANADGSITVTQEI